MCILWKSVLLNIYVVVLIQLILLAFLWWISLPMRCYIVDAMFARSTPPRGHSYSKIDFTLVLFIHNRHWTKTERHSTYRYKTETKTTKQSEQNTKLRREIEHKFTGSRLNGVILWTRLCVFCLYNRCIKTIVTRVFNTTKLFNWQINNLGNVYACAVNDLFFQTRSFICDSFLSVDLLLSLRFLYFYSFFLASLFAKQKIVRLSLLVNVASVTKNCSDLNASYLKVKV